MDADQTTQQLLSAILQTVGRAAFADDDEVLKIIGSSPRNLAAYKMCDGSRSQTAIAKAADINAGNFSRLVAKWEAAGILCKIGGPGDIKLLQVYKLP